MSDHWDIVSSLPHKDTPRTTELCFSIFWASSTPLLTACSFRGRLHARHNLRRLPACTLIQALSSVGLRCYKFLPSVPGEGGKHLPTRDYSISSLGTAHCGVESTEVFWVPCLPAVQKCVATITNEIFWFIFILYVSPYIMDPLIV
jgi:hypothetical protein